MLSIIEIIKKRLRAQNQTKLRIEFLIPITE